MLDQVIFGCSSAAPLFLGTDGLTDTQKARIKELQDRQELAKTDKKKELTDNMKAELADLLKRQEDFDNGIVYLSKGAKTYIETKVKEAVYGYEPAFAQKGNKYTEKGKKVEEDAIELLGKYFMTSYTKSTSRLRKGRLQGHPDIEDEIDEMIVDNKSSWSKETFPVLPRDIDSSTYEWQGLLYCYLKGWRKYRLAYTLMSTPETLQPDDEADDLHYVDDLPIGARVTYVDFYLTDENIAHIERRLAAAEIYAVEYYNELMSKINRN
jgi:hypothetical protein